MKYDKDFEIRVVSAKSEEPKNIYSDKQRLDTKILFAHLNRDHMKRGTSETNEDLLANTVVQ